MATGDSDDLLRRVKRLLPARWFATAAPIRDAVMGGLADLAAWNYGLTVYARAQTRLATATGPWLDLIAYDFLGLHLRRKGMGDEPFRRRIRATILQERVTRAGMVSVITQLVGAPPAIFEPWNTGDAGGWDTPAFAWAGDDTLTGPGGGWDAVSGWDANASCWDVDTAVGGASFSGAGGWGATDMPAQFLIDVPPAVSQGTPQIGGWDTGALAWDGGFSEWTDDAESGLLTADDIYETINVTRPTGVIAWVNLTSPNRAMRVNGGDQGPGGFPGGPGGPGGGADSAFDASFNNSFQ